MYRVQKLHIYLQLYCSENKAPNDSILLDNTKIDVAMTDKNITAMGIFHFPFQKVIVVKTTQARMF